MPWSALSTNKRNFSIAGLTKSLITAGKSVVHDAGQVMLSTAADVEKGPCYDTGRRGLVAMATFWLKTETVPHDSLPFQTVWPRVFTFFKSLPAHNQMRHFVRDCLVQKVVEILTQQLSIDANNGSTIATNPGLAGTAAT